MTTHPYVNLGMGGSCWVFRGLNVQRLGYSMCRDSVRSNFGFCVFISSWSDNFEKRLMCLHMLFSLRRDVCLAPDFAFFSNARFGRVILSVFLFFVGQMKKTGDEWVELIDRMNLILLHLFVLLYFRNYYIFSFSKGQCSWEIFGDVRGTRSLMSHSRSSNETSDAEVTKIDLYSWSEN